MSVSPEALVVILFYSCCLGVIWLVSPKLAKPRPEPVPWWRSVRFWASLVAGVQIVVYALWG
ncbi:MAG TPA: hypothetical protein VLK65_28245 [Vicinamibacteria bacterium]|nr:hypothetical protein [Vicinamibacteria bacterium]